MAVHFNSSSFGSVVIDGQSWGDVLVIADQVEARDDPRLDRELGTDHLIGDWELEKLLSEQPGIIIIGTGTGGSLRVVSTAREKIKKAGIELIVATTPMAIEEYNTLIAKEKKINALIHSTC